MESVVERSKEEIDVVLHYPPVTPPSLVIVPLSTDIILAIVPPSTEQRHTALHYDV